MLLHLTETEERNEDSCIRGLIRSHFRESYMDRQSAFLDVEFRIIYRMTRRSMENLRHDLYPYLRVHLTQQQIEGRAHGNRRPLTIDEKLGIGLVTCGGCSLAGVLLGFNVGRSCALATINQFFDAVFVSKIGMIHFPDTLHELQAASDAYMAKRSFNKYFYNHIGALDGLAVRIPMPSKEDTDNPLDFMTRKGFCAFNCQAIASAHDKCISLSVKCAGSTHDSTAWSVSDDGKKWGECLAVDPRTGRRFWISLDEAYAATANQLCPWAGTGLIYHFPYKDAFNYLLSGGCRNGIERIFGQVYQRFGMLWRPIMFPFARVPQIVQCLFQLHNYLKDLNDTNLPPLGSGLGACQADELRRAVNAMSGYDDQHYYSDECFTEEVHHPRYRQSQCPIREEITDQLENDMFVRPATQMNALVSGLHI